jgi:predicted nucleotidyltransferase
MMRPITDELVREITNRIVERFHPKRIIAFGSYARGEHRSHSDLDLIVEMESHKSFWERTGDVGALFLPRDWALDLLVYTPEELAQERKIWGTLPQMIEGEARVLYEQPA